MSPKSVILVDAGFLYAVAGYRTASTTLRAAITVQYETLIEGLVATVESLSSKSVLRTYWYDASRDGLFTDEHKKIGLIPGVKVRLGRINYYGEQKGVDLRLALDLVSLARTRAVSHAYLISGDDDLTEAVEEAQAMGMKVMVLGIKDVTARLGYKGVAEHLALAADSIEQIPDSLLDTTFLKIGTPSPVSLPDGVPSLPRSAIPKPTIMSAHRPEVEAPAPVKNVVFTSSTGGTSSYEGTAAELQALIESAEEIGKRVAHSWYSSTTQTELESVLANRPQLAPAIDRVLLKDCAQIIGEADTDLFEVRKALRKTFWAVLDELQ